MATLTASGINCSDGTLNGYYTGTDSQASHPIGAFVYAITGNAGTVSGRCDVNGTVPYIKYRTANDYQRVLYGPSSTASLSGWGNLAGTWRSRGGLYNLCNNTTYNIFAQRVA
jgi:hypothetical protein